MTKKEIDALVQPKPKVSRKEWEKRRAGEAIWSWIDRLAQDATNRETDRRRRENNHQGA